jgi:type II secretory pathway pseudopilin PulG
MKPFRIVQMLFGVFATLLLLLIAAGWLLPPFQNAENSRIEGLQNYLERALDEYRNAKGSYPDSLQALAFTYSPQEVRAQSDMKKMSYIRKDSGYQLSFKGFWYDYTLSVSNNGSYVFQSAKARL